MMILNRQFSSATLTYKWRCAACQATHSAGMDLAPGMQVWVPVVPDGWRDIEGVFYCPNHTISIQVDPLPAPAPDPAPVAAPPADAAIIPAAKTAAP